MASFKEMRKACDLIKEKYNLSEDEGVKIIQFFDGGFQIYHILKGDFSDVEGAARAQGVNISIKSNKAIKEEIKASIERVEGSTVEDLERGELPEDIEETIHNTIKEFCDKYNIDDISKPREGGSEDRWSAVCTYVGQKVFKALGIFRDVELCRKQGGTVYDAERVAKAQDLYNYMCKIYQHAYSISDCAEFLGISRCYVYGNGHGELTPARAQFIKKAQQDREASNRRGAIGARGGNTLGYITLLNYDNGYNKTAGDAYISDTVEKLPTKYPTFELPGSTENTENGENP